MTEEQFLTELADALEVETTMSMEDEFRDYDEWDSMMYLSLVIFLRESCSYELTPELFNEVDTWQDIYDRLSK